MLHGAIVSSEGWVIHMVILWREEDDSRALVKAEIKLREM